MIRMKKYSYKDKLSSQKLLAGKNFYLNSRLKDNHYDPDVHENPWIAAGKTPD